MTERDSYYEICIALDSAICAELWDIVASEIADFTSEGLEFAESGAIIIRTSQNIEFINALLAHLQGVCKDLSAINNQNIAFSHTIEVKQNRDWIAEYKKGIKPLRCGRFYIYPPWEKPLGNSSLGLHSADFANLGRFADLSPVSHPKFAKNHESQTENPSVVDSAESQNLFKNNPSLRADSQNLRGNPPIKKTQNLQGGLPRATSRARNDEVLDSSLRKCSAQNDNFSADSAESQNLNKNCNKNAESANKTQQTIEAIAVEVAEFLGDFECKTGLESAQCSKSPKSPQDAPKSKLQNIETINILLEPSLAFGTGHHSSTFMCIEAIQALHAQDSLKNKKVLDFGCGSGILALCAEKLGAVVDLCDIDELAIVESKKNFNNNNATISHIWQGGITDRIAKKGGIYDIILANIIASVLIEQKDNIALSLKRGGIAVLSGILDIYKDEVLARFSDFEPLAICQSDEWICSVLQKA